MLVYILPNTLHIIFIFFKFVNKIKIICEAGLILRMLRYYKYILMVIKEQTIQKSTKSLKLS